MVKNTPANTGDLSSFPGAGRSAGGGHGSPWLGESQGQRSLVGYSPWSHTELNRT